MDDAPAPTPATLTAPARWCVRLWLPDRPGALGQVASRIGAVHGDLLAIDILERGGGQVVDELVVSLPTTTSDELLVTRGRRRRRRRGRGHPRWSPPTAATRRWRCSSSARAVAEADPAERGRRAVHAACCDALEADWAVVIGRRGRRSRGPATPPDAAWLPAFLDGSGHLGDRARRRATGPGPTCCGADGGRRRPPGPGRPRARAGPPPRARPHRRPVLARAVTRVLNSYLLLALRHRHAARQAVSGRSTSRRWRFPRLEAVEQLGRLVGRRAACRRARGAAGADRPRGRGTRTSRAQ